MKNLQKMGGFAALIHAAAYVVGLVLGVTVIFPILDADPSQYMAFVTDNQAFMYIWNLIGYWVSAIALVVVVVALYERLKARSPVLAQIATVFGLIWATLIIGSGNLMLYDLRVVADLYSKNPAQAETVWAALEAVETGIVSGNELVGSLWVMLISLAALRIGGLPRLLNYLGVALSIAGILTIIPSLAMTMIMIFGPGMIVWFAWVGIVVLRNSPGAVNQS